LKGHFRNNKLQQLKNQYSSQQSLLFNGITQAENSVKESYFILEKTANCGKPFVDEEFVKECLQCTTDIICSAHKQAV
jgi:hypothetical protein